MHIFDDEFDNFVSIVSHAYKIKNHTQWKQSNLLFDYFFVFYEFSFDKIVTIKRIHIHTNQHLSKNHVRTHRSVDF